MNQLIPLAATHVPALIVVAGDRAQSRSWEFFVSNIRNPHTRRTCARYYKLLGGTDLCGKLHPDIYVGLTTTSHIPASCEKRPLESEALKEGNGIANPFLPASEADWRTLVERVLDGPTL